MAMHLKEKLAAKKAAKTAHLLSNCEDDNGYPELERLVSSAVASYNGPLFTTNATNLFDLFLSRLPESNRQHYDCHCCKAFIDKYGSLATMVDGRLVPFIFRGDYEYPEFFQLAIKAVYLKVLNAKVTGVYINDKKTWGTPQSIEKHPEGGSTTWTHLSGVTPMPVLGSKLKTAGQIAAEKLEDYKMLRHGLVDYPLEVAVQAARVLEADALYRSEKALGIAKWFLELHQSLKKVNGSDRTNLVWLAVATAPPGFCHVRSTIISTLLDDIRVGMDFDQISRRWADKMHPLQYQRPTATLTDGNVERAEKVIAELGAAESLNRRFAMLEDIQQPLWTPKEKVVEDTEKEGVFGHLRVNQSCVKAIELPPVRISWEKFRRTVLDIALEIEYYAPSNNAAFYGLVTAINPNAPPLLQWDGLEGHPRNSVSWYLYYGGSQASQWGLASNQWHKVDCIFMNPATWQEPEKFQHFGTAVFFALHGAKDLDRENGGGFFVETLRSEYREIRATMEKYSLTATVVGKEVGNANGVILQNNTVPLKVRVTTADGVARFDIDRME